MEMISVLSDTTIAENFGDSMGFVFKAPGQKTVYFAGDTIWHDYVEIALKKHKPDGYYYIKCCSGCL